MINKTLNNLKYIEKKLSNEKIKEIRAKKQKCGGIVYIISLENQSKNFEEVWIFESKNKKLRKEFIQL